MSSLKKPSAMSFEEVYRRYSYVFPFEKFCAQTIPDLWQDDENYPVNKLWSLYMDDFEELFISVLADHFKYDMRNKRCIVVSEKGYFIQRNFKLYLVSSCNKDNDGFNHILDGFWLDQNFFLYDNESISQFLELSAEYVPEIAKVDFYEKDFTYEPYTIDLYTDGGNAPVGYFRQVECRSE